MKLLERLSDCQILKDHCRIWLVSDCFIINLASGALGLFPPAKQYLCL